MPDLTCTGGQVLRVRPVPVLARDGVPYEATLELLLDGAPFGSVGERCGGLLADAAVRLRAVPPVSALEAGVRAGGGDWAALAPHLPRDRELFALRARDPDDGPAAGALRALVDVVRRWTGRGWDERVQVRVEAWGDAGTGVLAVLDLDAARAFLDALVAEADGDGGSPLTTL